MFVYLIPFILLFPFISQYKIFQAGHYELNRYLKYKCKNKCFNQVFLICLGIFFNEYIVSIAVLLLFYEKGKLVYTRRLKRTMCLYFVLIYLSLFLFKDSSLLICIFFYAFIIIIHCISVCIEKIIMSIYVKSAKKIIKGVRVVGITGSYGKTSSKNILYDLIGDYLNVIKTPKSFNNRVGIVKSIRENVSSDCELFICEYGVDKKGGMDKLLDVVKPNIALITDIGKQHISTFKTIDNIVNEKCKILDCPVCVLNNDNKYLKEKVRTLNNKVITYGIYSESNIMAKNVIVENTGSSFDLYIDNIFINHLNISLLGEHNIMNVLGAIGVYLALGLDVYKIKDMCLNIKPIEHRLELKYINGIQIIDDSFNSNEIGFKKAIDILSLMSDERWLITPGVIEQGRDNGFVNYELGKYCVEKIDFVILVSNNSFGLKRGLLDNGFDDKKILFFNNFIECWEYLKTIETDNKIFLIENDLPSIYLK